MKSFVVALCLLANPVMAMPSAQFHPKPWHAPTTTTTPAPRMMDPVDPFPNGCRVCCRVCCPCLGETLGSVV